MQGVDGLVGRGSPNRPLYRLGWGGALQCIDRLVGRGSPHGAVYRLGSRGALKSLQQLRRGAAAGAVYGLVRGGAARWRYGAVVGTECALRGSGCTDGPSGGLGFQNRLEE